MLLSCTLLSSLAAAPARADVYQVVRGTYYHGLPYELGHSLGPKAVPTLLELLAKPEEREHWANIITVLGMIGDDRATESLVEFLERRFEGKVDPATYRALLEVPTSLGLLARDPSSRAFAYLREGTSLEAWKDRRLSWASASLEREKRDLLMVRRSITGLGFSGTEAAREHLRGLQSSLEDTSLARVVQHDVSEAIEMSERVEELGYERVLNGDY
ncbi:MAG: hypothetical protein AAF560_32620 [Acidobacteriota bacterium]